MHNYKNRRIDNLIASLKLIGFHEYNPSYVDVLHRNIILLYKLNENSSLNVNLCKDFNTFTATTNRKDDIGVIEHDTSIDNKTLSIIVNILENVNTT